MILAMTISLFNSLTGTQEKFKPIKKGLVDMYNCGPTVYDRQHLGNLRSAVIWDLLRRLFELDGYEVNQVVNLTDFGHLSSDEDEGEDKMAKGLRRENLAFTLESMRTLAEKYAAIYVEDRKKLNCLLPTNLPFASDHIQESIELIKKLEEKDLTYKTSDGIYFDTSKIKNYIKFGPEEVAEKGESRIVKNPEKKSDRDFAVWKFATDKKIGWGSPWGVGFPGWHIECSVMSNKYLGETFDIHTGGIEHKPIHHTNEMAQSESASGKPMASFWLHNEHLILPDGKMAKSKGNSITLKDLEDKKIDPLSLRLLFLQANYRSPQIFSWDSLQASRNALLKIRNFLNEKIENGKPIQKYISEFKKIIGDDIDTPNALALAWKIIKNEKEEKKNRIATILEFDKVFGLNLKNYKSPIIEIPEKIKNLLELREKARKEKDFKRADEIRDEIQKNGFSVNDGINSSSSSKL